MNNKTKIAAAVMVAVLSPSVKADFSTLIPTLTNPLERQSAEGVWKTYQDLIANDGCFDAMLLPGVTSNGQLGSACTGSTYQLFKNVRAVVHTGNDLVKNGPTQFSLGLDLRGLGFALRWDAAEEYASQGSLASNYLQGQMSSLSARLSALRAGANGFNFRFSSNYNPDGSNAYQNDSMRGGSAGEDEVYSSLGGFLNYAMGTGTKAPTNLEDAFNFDGNQMNGGVDYRVNDQWVVGSLISQMNQRADFDSSKSVVSGNVETSGTSLVPFVMWQKNNFYVNAALNYQRISFDSLRAIRYPSLNPDVPSPNTTTKAKTKAITSGYTLGTGYDFNYHNLSIEPAINFNSSETKIDPFVEHDQRGLAFDLAVAGQSITQTSTSLGLTLRYTFTPSFAVITPYATFEQVQQSNAKLNVVESHYVNASTSADTFGIPTDPVDKVYQVNTFGIYSVVRGSHQSTVGGTFSGGIQIFVQFKQITGLQNYTSSVKEFGLRYEF